MEEGELVDGDGPDSHVQHHFTSSLSEKCSLWQSGEAQVHAEDAIASLAICGTEDTSAGPSIAPEK